jgi:hypothetical protein
MAGGPVVRARRPTGRKATFFPTFEPVPLRFAALHDFFFQDPLPNVLSLVSTEQKAPPSPVLLASIRSEIFFFFLLAASLGRIRWS